MINRVRERIPGKSFLNSVLKKIDSKSTFTSSETILIYTGNNQQETVVGGVRFTGRNFSTPRDSAYDADLQFGERRFTRASASAHQFKPSDPAR